MSSQSGPQTVPEDNVLHQMFTVVDKDRSNQITAPELQGALSNGTFEPFDIQTVRLMISMFDTNRTGSIGFEDFKKLWKYITDWLNCFRSFDFDSSGHIDGNELQKALTTFGYRFSDDFYRSLVSMFGRNIRFDDFIRISIHLQSLTEEFRKYDTDLDGIITLSYEQFVSLMFKIVINK